MDVGVTLMKRSALMQLKKSYWLRPWRQFFFAPQCCRKLCSIACTFEEDQNVAKLPILGKRNILITTALPSVSDVPHIGNICAGVLSADVFARYCRLRGYNVVYISGTYDYSGATETKAMEEKCSPEEICDRYHDNHREVYKWFQISFDKFGRTSTPQHREVCQAIFKKLWDNGFLYEKKVLQLYCEKCQRFLANRLVEGTCLTEGCREDQCENGVKLSGPTKLKDPKCKVCKSTPKVRDTNHLFLKLPSLKDELEKYINEMSEAGTWSKNAIQATHVWLKDELKALCITRDLGWGVLVPHDSFRDKVFDVRFEAPMGCISIASSYTPDWEKWWKNPDNVEFYQFMSMDNVPLHTVTCPSILIGTSEKWTLMKTISITECLKYEAGMFSKSKGIGVFGCDAKYTHIPVEVWRYYLLANRPELPETSFKWADMQEKVNSELLGNLSNFILQVLSFVAKPSGQGYGSIVPDAPYTESDPLTDELAKKVEDYVSKYIKAMEKAELKQGLETAMRISSVGNAYLEESQFLKLYNEDKRRCSIVVRTSLGLVILIACLLEPFMPSFSLEVFKQLNLPPETHISLCDDKGDIDRALRPWEIVPAGHRIGKPKALFKELKNEEVSFLRKKFSISQADRKEGQSKSIGRYRILKFIGSGATGTVFAGYDQQKNIGVAIKFVPFSNKRNWEDCFILEKVVHPNIVRVLDKIILIDGAAIVMEYVGIDLFSFVAKFREKKKSLEPVLIKRLLYQLLSGLQACHSCNIRHRDMKPANCLIDESTETLKLTDVGDSFEQTFVYMAPEILVYEGQRYQATGDVWGAGCVFAFMLSKDHLFHQKTLGFSARFKLLRKMYRLMGGGSTLEFWLQSKKKTSFTFWNWMSEYEGPPKRLREQFSPLVDADGMDLLEGMLRLDPSKRMTVGEALKHPYFTKK